MKREKRCLIILLIHFILIFIPLSRPTFVFILYTRVKFNCWWPCPPRSPACPHARSPALSCDYDRYNNNNIHIILYIPRYIMCIAYTGIPYTMNTSERSRDEHTTRREHYPKEYPPKEWTGGRGGAKKKRNLICNCSAVIRIYCALFNAVTVNFVCFVLTRLSVWHGVRSNIDFHFSFSQRRYK